MKMEGLRGLLDRDLIVSGDIAWSERTSESSFYVLDNMLDFHSSFAALQQNLSLFFETRHKSSENSPSPSSFSAAVPHPGTIWRFNTSTLVPKPNQRFWSRLIKSTHLGLQDCAWDVAQR